MNDKPGSNDALEIQLAELTRTLDEEKRRMVVTDAAIAALRKQIAVLKAQQGLHP